MDPGGMYPLLPLSMRLLSMNNSSLDPRSDWKYVVLYGIGVANY